ncbi:Crp/Fnr family transcriptional regulator [Flavobacterium soyangense]|uniref:Crp/Fnr family transcriptional regulator n=1 Tax=Flavobacterium soyangense TaxID=2023265 RepID=A0A930UAJ5_9FLAO|nr:Crp/Fnr family transcriptional regulator [Flavobacterium soyangense]MBF2707904.1 Crp/Fnr family transcriptional regulator [Flavobacterium soyangense]
MKTLALIEYFNRILPLDEKEIAFVEEIFKERKVKKRQFILQQGEICKQNTYVLEGCFRMYLVDPNGKEHNLQFAIENWWIGDIGSFHSNTPSKLNIEAIENSIILQVKKEDQLKLFTNYPKFYQIFRVLTENSMVGLQRRVLQNISATAEERYIDFLEKHPNLFNRISNVQIASYLGVTPEFLSTIRKKIAKS